MSKKQEDRIIELEKENNTLREMVKVQGNSNISLQEISVLIQGIDIDNIKRTTDIEEAYIKLWATVENGIENDFFNLREDYRRLIKG